MADPVLNAAGGGAKWTRLARSPRGWAEPRSRKGPSGRPLRLHGRFRNVRPPGRRWVEIAPARLLGLATLGRLVAARSRGDWPARKAA